MASENTKPPTPRLSEYPGSPLDWVQGFGDADEAIAYASIFWPEFVTHDGCVFLEFDDIRYAEWMNVTGGNRQRVEATMNHRHIMHLFGQQRPRPTRERLIQLGRLLKQMWECKLKREFPDRQLLVRFNEEDASELSDYEIRFHQVLPPAT